MESTLLHCYRQLKRFQNDKNLNKSKVNFPDMFGHAAARCVVRPTMLNMESTLLHQTLLLLMLLNKLQKLEDALVKQMLTAADRADRA